jgi:hypothetical protein
VRTRRAEPKLAALSGILLLRFVSLSRIFALVGFIRNAALPDQCFLVFCFKIYKKKTGMVWFSTSKMLARRKNFCSKTK